MRYTLAVTSCDRHHLLKQTLDSFLQTVSVFPSATVIVEDSDLPMPSWLSESKYKALGTGKWITNGQRRGQWFSLDTLYDALPSDIPFVFHLEDDWKFTQYGTNFIQRSADILNKHSHIWTVSLRGTACNGHPVVTENGIPVLMPGWDKGWGGCHFNPGLRRLKDFDRITSYGRHIGYGQRGCGGELTLSKTHLAMGYRIATLDVHPIIEHIGVQSRALENLPPLPRVLLAVPATHKYDYGTRTYGINRDTSGRVEAVRDTWFKDAAVFTNVAAYFFYGEPHKGFNPSTLVHPDVESLICPDDYLGLPLKTKAICEYALRHGYDFLIKADDDTILYVDRLMRSCFDMADQMGWKCPCNVAPGQPYRCRCYATGMCYTLSKRAMEAVACANPDGQWAEDYWVGGVLRAAGIQYARHSGWVSGKGKHYVDFPLPRNTVAAHSVKPEDIRKWYDEITRAFTTTERL